MTLPSDLVIKTTYKMEEIIQRMGRTEGNKGFAGEFRVEY